MITEVKITVGTDNWVLKWLVEEGADDALEVFINGQTEGDILHYTHADGLGWPDVILETIYHIFSENQ